LRWLKMKEWDAEGKKLRVTAIGNKGLGFMQRAGANVVSQLTGLGDTPHLEKLIGPVKVQLDAYMKGETDVLYIAFHPFHQHHEAGADALSVAAAIRRTRWRRRQPLGLHL
jgi:F0F1-type ATP synthase gamma subunit